MNHEDLLSALLSELDSAVSGLTRDGETPQIRRPGADYGGTDPKEWAYLALSEESVAARSGASSSTGDFSIELWVEPVSGDAFRAQQVAEAIRSHFDTKTIVVLGAASGSPATTRGVVDVTSIRVESIGAVEDSKVFDIIGTWQLRG